VLSRAKITSGSVRYYTAEVATSPEDYYLGHGETPGHWIGTGSAAEDLTGEVAPAELHRLFTGSHPRTGEPLGAAYCVRSGAQKVAGWDLTFSAPKSVSALWATGGGAVGTEVRDAHDAAVVTGVAYLETHGCFSRTGKAGIAQVDTDGFMAAAFDHRASRAGDPQLHTHVLISGRVRCADQTWRALDSRALHTELKTAGMLYQAALRAELTSRLGVAWTTPDRHGQAEIRGVPSGLVQHWSSRRAEIDALARSQAAEREATLGRPLTAEERRDLYQDAVLATRPPKSRCGEGIDETLFARWRDDAAEAGFEPERWLDRTLGRATGRAREVPGLADDVLVELEASSSTWARTDVVRQVVRRLGSRTAPDAEAIRRRAEQLADQVLDDRRSLCLVAPQDPPPTDLRRRDGRSVFEHHGALRYSTREALAAEQRVLDIVTRGRDAGIAVVRQVAVEGAAVRWTLSDDQVEAVVRLTGGEAVTCLVGPAGTGKTRTVGAAAEAWSRSGTPVRGLAVSAAAAGVLGTEAGIPTDTLARFLLEADRSGAGLQADEVVVLDEVGMVASADLARLLTVAEAARAKVVLVGDARQLGPVGAGGLFRLLATDAAELASVHRFAEPWERDASLRLRAGDADVLAAYDDRGRISGGDRGAVLDGALDRWRSARAEGLSVVVCAPDHATVDELALRARAERAAAGEVEAAGVAAGAQVVGVGDEVVTTRNDRALLTTGGAWVRNGDRWRVLERHPDGGLLVDDATRRGTAELPADYVGKHVRLAYAVTLHKAQGVTVDVGVVVADGRTTAEALYVGMTRGRLDNVALAVCEASAEEYGLPERATPLQVLERVLARSGAHRSGLEVLRTAFDESRSLATLAPQLAHLDAWIRREQPPDRSRELRRAREEVERFDRYGRPGWRTAAARAERRRGEGLRRGLVEVEAEQAKLTAWRHQHADTLAARDRLAEAVADRRDELGRLAVSEQPDHLTGLLGPVPKHSLRADRWRLLAGRVEAYREEWRVPPEKLGEAPTDLTKRTRWRQEVKDALSSMRLLDRQRACQIGRSQIRSRSWGLER
jgi:conjugative relaxase-like TrwC/TraI family protein